MASTRFIALFRGVNVGGRIVKMAQLKEWMSEVACTDIQTYLQSGNAVFKSAGTAKAVQQRLEEGIAERAGEVIPVLVKTAAQWDAMIEGNPYVGRKGIDESKLHVTLLQSKAPAAAVKKLAPKMVTGESFEVVGEQVYLYCPAGYGNTKMSNAYFERILGSATTRNWRTVLALQELVAG